MSVFRCFCNSLDPSRPLLGSQEKSSSNVAPDVRGLGSTSYRPEAEWRQDWCGFGLCFGPAILEVLILGVSGDLPLDDLLTLKRRNLVVDLVNWWNVTNLYLPLREWKKWNTFANVETMLECIYCWAQIAFQNWPFLDKWLVNKSCRQAGWVLPTKIWIGSWYFPSSISSQWSRENSG